MRPLDGITVVSLEQAIAAPFATRHLAELGARVIKIERPGSGDFARAYDHTVRGLCSHFVWANRSKESLTLDLKHAAATEVMARLLAQADVFVQNLAPGATERLGLDAVSLAARHPRLIVCDISGYGDNGPYRDKKAYDLLIQGESGLLAVTGTEGDPAKAGIPVADISAGMYAYSAILAALYERQRSGRGTRVEVSLFEALTEWMGFPLYYDHYGGTSPAPSGAHHATIAPYGPFHTGDGGMVMLAVQNEREWAAFCAQVLGRPELAGDARFGSVALRLTNREDLIRIVEAAFADLSAAQVLARLDAAQIANARMNGLDAVWQHPQLQARGRWRQVDTAAGPIQALLPPMNFAHFEARMDPVPALGAHTDRILEELGYGAGEIERLRKLSAI